MFLQLPLTAMRTALQVTPQVRFVANYDRYNSAVRKAGSFEGTLPRCFFCALSGQTGLHWETFSVFPLIPTLPMVDIPNTKAPRLSCAN
jgi:hypothetical protein